MASASPASIRNTAGSYPSTAAARASALPFPISTSLRVDYIIAPLKVLQSLKDLVKVDVGKYAHIQRLSPQSAAAYEFTENEMRKAYNEIPPSRQLANIKDSGSVAHLV